MVNNLSYRMVCCFGLLNATFDPITASTSETVQSSDRTRRKLKEWNEKEAVMEHLAAYG